MANRQLRDDNEMQERTLQPTMKLCKSKTKDGNKCTQEAALGGMCIMHFRKHYTRDRRYNQ